MTTKQQFHSRQIPSVLPQQWKELAEEARSTFCPIVVSNLFEKVSMSWSPQQLATQFGNKEVSVVVDLPKHGVPYKERSKDYQRRMRLSDFISILSNGRSCYLNQVPLVEYPNLYSELDVKSLSLGRIFAVNLWVGSKTHSGLHFDRADNLFGQVYGVKRALLVSPTYTTDLYQFADNPSKSQIDLEEPDFNTYPKSKRIQVWSCTLTPGDGLYIPRGWWHHIYSEDISISVNCWHGDSLSEADYAKRFFAGGPRVVARAAYDFVWHGLMRRPYHHRLFSPPPPGLNAYERLKSH